MSRCCGFPVVKRIDVPRVPAGRGGCPGLIVREAMLAVVGDGQKSVIGFIGANAHQHGCRTVQGKPVGKRADKGFKGHSRLVKIKIIRSGDGAFRWLAHPAHVRRPALPFRLIL